jgi:hypothetical protein
MGAGLTDASDLVDCGSGVDTALVLPNDRVRANCEEVIEASVPHLGAALFWDERRRTATAKGDLPGRVRPLWQGASFRAGTP